MIWEGERDRLLCNVCDCTGTQFYIHQSCLAEVKVKVLAKLKSKGKYCPTCGGAYRDGHIALDTGDVCVLIVLSIIVMFACVIIYEQSIYSAWHVDNVPRFSSGTVVEITATINDPHRRPRIECDGHPDCLHWVSTASAAVGAFPTSFSHLYNLFLRINVPVADIGRSISCCASSHNGRVWTESEQAAFKQWHNATTNAVVTITDCMSVYDSRARVYNSRTQSNDVINPCYSAFHPYYSNSYPDCVCTTNLEHISVL
jgi:hypothetical protein